MAKTELKARISQEEKKAEELFGKLRTAIKSGKMNKVGEAEDALKKQESDVNKLRTIAVYQELLKTENPAKSALTLYQFSGIGHKMVREKGSTKVVDCEPVSKDIRVDILGMCLYSKGKSEYKEVNGDWQYNASALNYLLCLRTARELKMTEKEIDTLCQTYYLKDKVREIKMGGVPDSNNKICALLQKTIDAILFEDDGKGKNVYKCNSHDVAFLLNAYTRKDKKELFTISVSKDSQFRFLVYEVMKRIMSGAHYGVNGFKVVKA